MPPRSPPVSTRFELAREVEAACPGDRAVRSAVGRRLGYDPFDDSSGLLLSARISAKDGGLQGVVELVDESGSVLGRREVFSSTPECTELASALVLAISIVLDPPQALAATEPPPSPAPLRWAGLLGGHAAVGAAPAPSLGAVAGVVGRRQSRSWGLTVRVDLPRSADASGGRVRTTAAVATLSACAHWRALGGCGVGGIGAMRASGEGFDDAGTATRPVLHAGPRLSLAQPLVGPLSVVVHADGLVALLQTNLRVGGVVVWSTPVFSAVLGVALRCRLW